MTDSADHGRESLFVDVLLELVGRRPLVVLLDPDVAGRAALLDRLACHLRAGDALVQTGDVPANLECLPVELGSRLAAAPLGVLVVDHAESLEPDLLRRLVDMAGGQASPGPMLQVLLAGDPALAQPLHAQPLREVVDRVGAIHHVALEPSTAAGPVDGPPAPGSAVASVPPVPPAPALAARVFATPGGVRRRVVLAALGFVAFAAGLAANTAARHLAPPDISEQRLEVARAAVPAPLPKAPQSQPAVAEVEADMPVPVPGPAAPPESRRSPSQRQVSNVPPSKPLSRTQRSRQVTPADGCRRGPGGQTAREASVQAVLEGFVDDIRSLGHCLAPSASSR